MAENLKYISFDIFDTVLFRTVCLPQEVFGRSFDRMKTLLPEYMNDQDWREMRIKAEAVGRRKKYEKYKNYELTLDEIYKELPSRIQNRDKLIEIELNAEKEACYLNKEIYERIKWINENTECKVILISDMYLNRNQVEEILVSNGFDLNLIEKIYMSSDYFASKRSGELYKIVLAELGIRANQMLHIGDNEVSDISAAKRLGISTEYYDTISCAETKHPFLYLENLRNEGNASEVFALRNYVGSLYKDEAPEDRFWYQLGSMILGPLFTYGMEWVLDVAEKNGIKRIFPLMREGHLFSRLLKSAIQDRNIDIEITKLYVSRMATYLASLEEVKEEHLEFVFSTFNLSVKDIFQILNMEEFGEQFSDYYEYEISKSRDVLYGDTNLYNFLLEYLQCDALIFTINERARSAREVVQKYFKQVGMDKPYITVDIGWKGSIQASINRIQQDSSNIHLLLMGVTASLTHVLNGCDIRGFVGTHGKNMEDIRHIFVRIIELMTMCEEGTTLGYEDCGEYVQPIKREIIYTNSEQLSAIKKCQEGMARFQQEYFELRKQKPSIENLKSRPEELVRIVGRLTSSPLFAEAKLLGELYYDQNFGANSLWKVIDDGTLELYRAEGLHKLLSRETSSQPIWYAGLQVLEDPFVYFTNYFIQNGQFHQLKRLSFARHIKEVATEKVVIVGAGLAGRDIYKFLMLADSEHLVECFVDNDIDKQNTYLYNKKICALEENMEASIYIVGSFAYVAEIVNRIRSVKGDQVKIISYRGEEQ